MFSKGLQLLFGIKKKPIPTEPTRKMDMWIKIISLLIFIPGIIYISYADVDWKIARWLFIGLMGIQVGSTCFNEWKYLKETRQYIVTTIQLVIAVLFIYHIQPIMNFFI